MPYSFLWNLQVKRKGFLILCEFKKKFKNREDICELQVTTNRNCKLKLKDTFYTLKYATLIYILLLRWK